MAAAPRPADGFSVVAIIAAYNEADVIGQVVADLVAQGARVYLLDHGSTDGTVAAVEPYLGRGVLGVERFAEAPGFALEAIVRRKEALARELPATWFINHDADEFRESPWAHLNLVEGIRAVDDAGYNAIDFELLNFWPTHDRFRPGDDVRAMFTRFERGQPWDKVQIRCWKNGGAPVDLASSGGHEARFPGRAVFPFRFILRHYPIRSQAHGERKVFRERRERFADAERHRGWHVQYDGVREGDSFLRDPATLTPWDPDRVRLELALRHRGVEEGEAALVVLRAEVDALRSESDARSREVERLSREITALHASRSWRWTAPLRAAQRLLGRR